MRVTVAQTRVTRAPPDSVQGGMSKARNAAKIVNVGGLPAARLANTARSFQSRILVSCHGTWVSADSLLDLLELRAARGDLLEILAEGPDAERAADALAALVATGFGDDEGPKA